MKIGIIGGSGAEDIVKAFSVNAKKHHIPAPDGCNQDLDSVDYIDFRINTTYVAIFLRHGEHADKDPANLNPLHLVNAMKKVFRTSGSAELSCSAESPSTIESSNTTKSSIPELIIQTSASGSLDTSIKLADKGGIVVCSDLMRGFGFQTSYNGVVNGEMNFPDMKQPFSPKARALALEAIAETEGAVGYDGGIYVNNQGNQFETKAEVAALCCTLDTPRVRFYEIMEKIAKAKAILNNTFMIIEPPMPQRDYISGHDLEREHIKKLIEEEAIYRNLYAHLSVRHATLSMNAARETPLLIEAGFKEIVLLSFPVNYGAGLVAGEKVNHKRTKDAMEVAASKYIAPVLTRIIQKAGDYYRSHGLR